MPMNRRDFLHTTGALALTAAAVNTAQARVRVHNWDKYDFGSGPPVKDRLNQGPFPQYPPDASIPNDPVITAASSDKMSPKRFSVNNTSNRRGFAIKCIAHAST